MSVVKLEYNDIAESWSLVSYASLKNYDAEIQLFVDWITPYLDVSPETMIAYSRYEETKEPTIYYSPER